MLTGIPCTLMRGGTSKGLYFHADDLPGERALRDRVLLAAMGSPDVRQIDGLGGAHPLTSKVAVVTPSHVDGADVDYLFLQVVPDRAIVSDAQTSGLGSFIELFEFRDCPVIGLGVFHAADREPDERADNQSHQDPELPIGVHDREELFSV